MQSDNNFHLNPQQAMVHFMKPLCLFIIANLIIRSNLKRNIRVATKVRKILGSILVIRFINTLVLSFTNTAILRVQQSLYQN